MRVNLIGHASMLIETKRLSILMDPVLWDPHQEGLFDIFPARSVQHNKLPHYDIIVLSHRHLDHFHVRSLSSLSKRVPIFIPGDELLKRYLERLGFVQIKLLNDFAAMSIRGTQMMTTRSENRVPEYGFVVADESGVLWNQVDSVVSEATATRVRARFGKVDLLIARWQPMLESDFQTNKPVSFPYARYDSLLKGLAACEARVVIPGANAFSYRGPSAWLNHLVFPLTREQFLKDVRSAMPGIDAVYAVEPGDVLEILDHTVTLEERACSFVSRAEHADRTALEFSPTSLNTELVDPNPLSLDNDSLSFGVRAAMALLQNLLLSDPERFSHFARWKIVYELKVVYPAYSADFYIDFQKAPYQVCDGRAVASNFCTQIAASCLCGLASANPGWDYTSLGGFFRSFKRIYIATEWGIVVPPEDGWLDPLELLYPYQDAFEKLIEREIRTWADQSSIGSEDSVSATAS